MAVRISPCYRCPLGEGCEQRAEFRRRVAGLGLRSAAFPCDRLAAELRPGRRVIIMQPVLTEHPGSWEPETHVVKREVAATVTSVSGHYRFACTVDLGAVGETEFDDDADPKKRFRRMQAHYRIVRFLDEPDGKVCRFGNVVKDGVCHTTGECVCRQEDELAAEFSTTLSAE